MGSFHRREELGVWGCSVEGENGGVETVLEVPRALVCCYEVEGGAEQDPAWA